MSSPEVVPNNPEFFDALKANMTSFAENGIEFGIPPPYAYPRIPDRIHLVGGAIFQEDVPPVGRIAIGESVEPDGLPRLLCVYEFNDTYKSLYQRFGELAVSPRSTELRTRRTEVYWVETNGTVWTRSLVRPYEKERRQLADPDVEFLARVTSSIWPIL